MPRYILKSLLFFALTIAWFVIGAKYEWYNYLIVPIYYGIPTILFLTSGVYMGAAAIREQREEEK